MAVSTESATPPKSTKSKNPNSLMHIQMNFKFEIEFVPRDNEESEFLDLVDFGGAAFSVETGIGCLHSHFSFSKRATKYRLLLWEMTYIEKGFLEAGFRPLCPTSVSFVLLSRTKPLIWISTRKPISSQPGSILVDGFDTRLIPRTLSCGNIEFSFDAYVFLDI